jgi:hypothetical protein
MTAMTCLEQATEAYLRPRGGDRQRQLDDCVELAEWKLLSNRHLSAITGLPEATVAAISKKSDHSGGRLNVTTLPLLLAIEQDWKRGHENGWLMRQVVEQGTSMGMLSLITGISFNDVRRLVRA